MAAMLFAFAAHAKIDKSELIGQWVLTQTEKGINIISVYDFMDNDRMSQMVIMTGTSPKMTISANGTCDYRVEDGSIIFKFSGSDFEFTTFEIEGIPEDYIELAKQQIKSQMVNVEQKMTNVKIKGNKLEAKVEGEKVTMTRK